MTKDEALKRAIKEIEEWLDFIYEVDDPRRLENKALNACKEALEQPAQKPDKYLSEQHGLSVYTHPHQWQDLTEDDIKELQVKFCQGQYHIPTLIKGIQNKLKEKNT